MLNILDVTYLIDYLYKGGAAPLWPSWRADANGDEAYNLLDVVYNVNYLYKDGPRPKAGAHRAAL